MEDKQEYGFRTKSKKGPNAVQVWQEKITTMYGSDLSGDINDLMATLNNIVSKYGSKYSKIMIDFSSEEFEYGCFCAEVTVYGLRDETAREKAARINKENQEKQEKKLKRQEKNDRDRAEYERLKKIFEKNP